MHWPLEEKYWVAEFRERAGFLVDAERADALFAKRAIGSDGAPGHIEHAMIRRRPRILNVSRQSDRAAGRERSILDVELYWVQYRTDGCVEAFFRLRRCRPGLAAALRDVPRIVLTGVRGLAGSEQNQGEQRKTERGREAMTEHTHLLGPKKYKGRAQS